MRDIDFIGKVETLGQDLQKLSEILSIPYQDIDVELTNRSKHKHYIEYYDDETRQLVAEKYAKDIEYFGYKFGE
jgi:hypothetical protein